MEYLGLKMVKLCSMISIHANTVFLQAQIKLFDVQLWWIPWKKIICLRVNGDPEMFPSSMSLQHSDRMKSA